MIELWLLAAIVVTVAFALRRGKPVAGRDPLIIRRQGQYHITLDPQLRQAQSSLELIAAQLAATDCAADDVAAQYFEVCESAAGDSYFLLAVAQRKGLLFIQAITPLPLLGDADSHLNTIRQFSEAVLALQPMTEIVDACGADKLQAAVMAAAAGSGLVCTGLDEWVCQE